MPLMPPPPQLTFADLSTWLQGIVDAAGTIVSSTFPHIREGPYIPDMPDELCTITLTGGTGFQMEGAADAPTFQARIRSQQQQQDTAEQQANVLDKLIFNAQFPATLASGLKLLLVSRIGGAPSSIGPPDDAYRFDYVCNYYAIVGAP
ncbi:MAG TPA: hypothetical protein VGR71_05080 [Nitrospira sp.]|nr:hypothetical protein [Nitrospira sp.]